ncbi:alpha-2-macroglobulin family protein [Gynurincola endophyticus]|uniref:alpha-2-macroglobulin family protein n=1 Tax=Gynurincola endophyticus TaxID=2479004 RepID=UPI000F8E56E1|nr:alpha-2-macroglobulin family protein [Gynurincola endophyticus]
MLKKLFALPILILLTMVAFSQQNNFLSEWKKIDTLPAKEFFTNSTNTRIQNLLQQAVQQKNTPYSIKAYDALIKHKLGISGNNFTDAYNYLSAQKSDHHDITCEFLELLEVKLLTQYKINNYYQILRNETYDSTNIISQWTIQQLDEKITRLYTSILQNKNVFGTSSVNEYKPLLTATNVPQYTPYLIDAIMVDILKNITVLSEQQLQPTAFVLTDTAVLNAKEDFVKQNFDYIEAEHLKGLFVIYQEILKHYLNSGNAELLAYTDYQRLNFAYTQLQVSGKRDIYYKQLHEQFKKFPNTRLAAWAGLAMADLFYESGNEYHPYYNPAPQYDLKKAAEIYEKIHSYFKKVTLSLNYQYNLNNLNTQTANILIHPYVQPQKPVLVTVSYKNITQLKIKVYQIKDLTVAQLMQRADYETKFPSKQLTQVQQKSFTLKSFNDLQTHTTDVALDPLPAGQYYVEYEFNNSKSGSYLNVSNTSFIQSENQIVVLNKTNSAPIANATVKLWKNQYNNKLREYEYILQTTQQTDNKGIATFKTENYNYAVEIINGTDRFLEHNNTYFNEGRITERAHKTTSFFLDRSIYRPGQTVYFKGISYGKKATEKEKIVANENIEIEVYDVNDNVIYKQSYTTNKMGSFSGSFKLPASTLGGSFYIKSKNYTGTKYFSVEEYKRPKYKVEFATIEKSYQLNDSIEAKGKAIAYAGYPIQNAKVTYTVRRVTYLPRWCYFFNPYIRFNESVILTTGTATTDDEGHFNVPFKAIPANSIEKRFSPRFAYEISATVTDLSGETHDANQSIHLGWNRYEVDFGFGETFDIKNINALPISIQNFQGQKQEAKAVLTIQPIQPPAGTYHQRYASAQKIDVITIDSINFKKLFPNEVFYREDEQQFWKETGKKIEIPFVSNKDGKLDISAYQLQKGWYRVTVTVEGEPQIQPTTMVQLYENTPVSMFYKVNINTDKNVYNFNDAGNLTIQTNLPSGYQYLYSTHEGVKNTALNFEPIQPLIKKSFQLKETPQAFVVTSLVGGRLYTATQPVYPMNPAQKLEVKIVQKKDTLMPGEKATFQLEVTGNTKDVELLSVMYDASLDVFRPHYWDIPYNNSGTLKYFNWMHRLPGYWASKSFLDPKKEIKTDSLVELIGLSIGEYNIYYNRLYMKNTTVRSVAARGGEREMAEMAAAPVQQEAQAAFDTAAPPPPAAAPEQEEQEGPLRENFNETAFFYPHIEKDANGKATITFTIPDALTEWKWMILAHNTDLGFSYITDRVITQKDLMIETNVPRFLRQGDSINYVAKLINVSNKNIEATLEYQSNLLSDGKNTTSIFADQKPIRISVPANSTKAIDLRGIIPADLLDQIEITLRVNTDQPGLTDAVKNVIQVLPNSSVITAARNFYLSGNGNYDFKFPELKSTLSASTLGESPVMVSMHLNPSWEVINSLPYIAKVRYESNTEYALQIYANALAHKIVKDNPAIKDIMGEWKEELLKTTPKGTLEDLAFQAISTESSPWLAEAENEKAHKAAIIHLFNDTLIQSQIAQGFEKLRGNQRLDGGFSWFKGSEYSSTYITTNILLLLGELNKWNAITFEEHWQEMINNALNYLDRSLKEQYRYDSAKHISNTTLMYLYMRDMFKKPIEKEYQTYHNAYLNAAYNSWDKLSIYGDAVLGTIAKNNNNEALSKRILASLKDRATVSDTLGMYWKENISGYFWSQNQLLVQASLIEFFDLMQEDVTTIHQMQKWLLRLKETNRWENAASTANIIKAFFVKDGIAFTHNPSVSVQFNKSKFDFKEKEVQKGYIQIYKEYSAKDIKSDNIKIKVKNADQKNMIWGNIIWRYQLPFDQIQPNDNELKINKTIFYNDNNIWKKVEVNQSLPVGTKVKVVMSISTDRPMEYIHIQDDRAANMEPTEQMSGYRFTNRLFYYQSIKDANNHFFIDNLPAGTHNIEYECFINQTGSFYNGVSIIESYYAPNYRNQSATAKISSN